MTLKAPTFKLHRRQMKRAGDLLETVLNKCKGLIRVRVRISSGANLQMNDVTSALLITSPIGSYISVGVQKV
jgi:hypothetical protein